MDAIAILNKNGLSKTQSRVNILKLLQKEKKPISVKDICDRLDKKCDKSTVHRTLNSFYENHLIQRIISDSEIKYVFKNAHQRVNKNEVDHVHFKCSVCKRLFCMKDLIVSNYELPDGFTKEENQFLIIGKCNECQ